MLQHSQFIEAGFEQEVVKQWDNNGGFKEMFTSRFLGTDTEPVAYIENSLSVFYGRIGALQWKLTNQAELDQFTNKIVPTFCDLK
ncbi:hypothetical protein [Dyadobacter frigoris]|uniref:Uncharacterized protein n=1 Tax=Dyadobacter frigoris TaxID=2576211 RepID=A0A4U6CXD7_9BACT|nr:hypothetical protein [Dyadobacter frigoris]TKT89500.1 hypothetical protein FDK13_24465 [Dyadobacter frigoris]